jgi:opacity protein-like surface antigen
MKITRILVIAALAGIAVASEVQAQVDFEITPFGGGTLFLADPPNQFMLHRGQGSPVTIRDGAFDDAWTLGVNAGFRINERWGIEGMFSWLPTSLTSGSGAAQDVDGYMYGLTGLFYVPIEGRVKPFLGVGVGGETFNYASPDIDSHTDWMGNVVGGLYLGITDMTGLRLEARDCFARFDSGVPNVSNAWENDLMLTLGVSFRSPMGR